MIADVAVPKLIRLREAARALNTSPQQVRMLVKSRKLSAVRIGSRWLSFDPNEITRFIAASSTGNGK
jgi:excisionase family DNA binding protein